MAHHPIGRMVQWLGACALTIGVCADTAATRRNAGPAAVVVWAAGDAVRVDPLSGRYLEDRRDIHADYPSGDYHHRNAVWDAVRLRAGRLLDADR